ncbi:uncharacterized protein LOC108735320 [Agrilus planipennis]|uniref:Uncharacterized protein LOC108735320 n=1 Tax=Agrilus planipennis TaxID=224129 RepID=A0A1W4WFN4_AGRPL|nr:uncharacterized protein LOC108735320 [Agrilus planipennis]
MILPLLFPSINRRKGTKSKDNTTIEKYSKAEIQFLVYVQQEDLLRTTLEQRDKRFETSKTKEQPIVILVGKPGTSLMNNTTLIEGTHDCMTVDNTVANPIANSSNSEISDDREVPYLKLFSKIWCNQYLPRKYAYEIVNNVNSYFADEVNSLKQDILEKLTHHNLPCNILSDITTIFNNVASTRLSSKLSSEYKCIKFFKEGGLYIEPISVVIGSRQKIVKKNNLTTTSYVNATATFIPIRKILQKIFEVLNVFTATLEYINYLRNEKNIISNFIQANLWKTKSKSFHPDQLVLPLFLYYDDFECGNPLGSHSGINKIGGVYYCIPCLPPQFSSKLNNIFMALLFKTQDRKRFGNQNIFNIIIEELQYLHEVGIEVSVSGKMHRIFFQHALTNGDNLGQNQMLGFVENFIANYCCRFCKLSKEMRHSLCYEKAEILRTEENYAIDLECGDISSTGLKEKCVFHRFNYFHVTENYSCDPIHDLLERICKTDIAFILYYFISTLRFFSIGVLNNRISTFKCNIKVQNLPLPLDLEELGKGTLRLSASEVLFLSRYLPIYIGDFVPEGNVVWKLYLTLRKILNIVTCKFLQKDTSNSDLISKHNKLYKQLTKAKLTFKFNMLTHYPRIFKECGPLDYLSSMRFESKHQIFKTFANSNKSRVNILKSLAIKYQISLANTFLEDKLNADSLTYGKKFHVHPIPTIFLN